MFIFSFSLSSVSDHKRAVRPRERQKPSSAHLQLLNKRNDISSEMDTPTSGATPKSDPNAYSTYMGQFYINTRTIIIIIIYLFIYLLFIYLFVYYLFICIFVGKKVLDHSALLGLAAKLDFTTVKLRKTGIVEQVTQLLFIVYYLLFIVYCYCYCYCLLLLLIDDE